MPRSLYRRIYMHFLGVLFFVAFVSSLIFAGGWQRSYLTEVAERLTMHTAVLLARTPPSDRIALARELADEMQLDLALFDARGDLVVRVGAQLPPIPRDVPVRASITRDHPYWYVTAPVRASDGVLVLQISPRHLGGWPLPLRPIGAFALLLFVVAVAVKPLARRISRPVERLIEASRRFGDGDLTMRVRTHRHARHEWREHLHKKWQQHVHRHWQRRRGGDELMVLTYAWNDMAERIERQVGAQRELLANVSHELRSPLARVRVALALLPEEEATRQRIADIEADLAELDDLIEAILQTAKLEATSLPAHTERIPVGTLFAEVLSRANADPLTAPLGVSIDPAATGEGLVVEGDRGLLRRALFNLVENAGKYGAAPVTLAATRTEGLVLSVTDAGPGVPASERERMTRPFSRSDRAHTPGRGGVGLGLSFASRVAAVHGGTLALDDAPNGRGLVVRIELPAARVVSG